MAYSCSPVVTSKDEWTKICEESGLVPVIVAKQQYVSLQNLLKTSNGLASTINALTNHLFSSAILLKFGNKPLSPAKEMEIMGSWKTNEMSMMLVEALGDLILAQHTFITVNDDGPARVNPTSAHIEFIEYPNQKRIWHAYPDEITPYETGDDINLQSATALASRKGAATTAASKSGSKRKRKEDGSADEKERLRKLNEYPSMLVFSKRKTNPNGEIVTAIHGILQLEMRRERFLDDAVEASGTMSRPKVFTVPLPPPSAVETSTAIDYNTPKDSEITHAEARANSTSAALAASQQLKQMKDQQSAVLITQQEQKRLRQMMPVNDIGNPMSRRGLATMFDTPTQEIPDGRTGFNGPRAEVPPILSDYLLWVSNQIGQSVGVPAAMTGDNNHAIAVNQTTLFVFNATLQHSRAICSGIVSEVFKYWRGTELSANFDSDLKKETAGKAATTDALARVTKNNIVSAGFPGLMDPVLLFQLWDLGAFNANTFVECMSGICGLPASAFDPKRMEEKYRLDTQLKQATVEQVEAGVENTEANTEAAEASTKALQAGLTAAGVPKKPASASASASAPSSAKQPAAKRIKTGPGMKTSVDRSLTAHGGGQAVKPGATSSKDRHPQTRSAKKV